MRAHGSRGQRGAGFGKLIAAPFRRKGHVVEETLAIKATLLFELPSRAWSVTGPRKGGSSPPAPLSSPPANLRGARACDLSVARGWPTG